MVRRRSALRRPGASPADPSPDASAAEPRGAVRPSADAVPPPLAGIGRLLRDAHMAFTRLFTARLAEHGVSFGQFQHLQHLWYSDGISQTELAARIGIPPAASTAVLLSLEQSGLIRRERDLEDRRRVNVFLTARGADSRAPLTACVREMNEIACAGLDHASVSTLVELVGTVTRNVQGRSLDTR